MIILDLIQIICGIILICIIYKLNRMNKYKNQEIFALNQELDTVKFNISKDEIKVQDDYLKISTIANNTLLKIQSKYSLSKSDKLVLIQYMNALTKIIDKELLSKIDISKKYSYKEATNIIISYINKPKYINSEIIEVLNALYFLIVK